MLKLEQHEERKRDTLKDIKINRRNHFSNVAATERRNDEDNMYLSLFSDSACATAIPDTDSVTVKDKEIKRGKYEGEVELKQSRRQTFGDDLVLADFEGYSMALFDADATQLACCMIAVVEKEVDASASASASSVAPGL